MIQRRARSAVVALLAAVTTLFTVPTSAHARPPAPGNASQAQDAALAAAQRVTRAETGVRRAAEQVRRAQRIAALTQQSLQRQLWIQRSATTEATAASTHAVWTKQASDTAHRAFVAIATADFQSGTDAVMLIGALLTARDPAEVLAAGARQAMVAEHHAAVVEQARSTAAADAIAQRRRTTALQQVRAATAGLEDQVRASTAAVRGTQRLLRALRHELGSVRATQAQSDAVLSSFLGGWTLADPQAARTLNTRYLQQVDGRSRAPLPRGRGWSPEKGQAVAWRALAWIGTSYAWAGGTPRARASACVRRTTPTTIAISWALTARV